MFINIKFDVKRDKDFLKTVYTYLQSKQPNELQAILNLHIDNLPMSTRSANCLKSDNIVYIGDLVQKSECDLIRTPNLGRKSLNEIKEGLLINFNLGLGADLNGCWKRHE